MARIENKIISSPEQFIVFFSHELKTPLTGLSAFSQLLLRYLADKHDSKGLEYATRIAQQTGKLTELVEEILDLSRLNADTIVLNEESCDIGEVLKGVFTEEKVQISPNHSFVVSVDTSRFERFLSSISTYVHSVKSVGSTVTLYVKNFPLLTIPESLEEIYKLDGKDKKIIGLELFLTQKIFKLQNIIFYLDKEYIGIQFKK